MALSVLQISRVQLYKIMLGSTLLLMRLWCRLEVLQDGRIHYNIAGGPSSAAGGHG